MSLDVEEDKLSNIILKESNEAANAKKVKKTFQTSNQVNNLNISDIQWHMIDKSRYFPFTIMNMFAVRTVLYPLTLVRTRLQIQSNKKKIYSGTFDALRSIVKYEGYFSLYKGFLVNTLALVPHVVYIVSYEKVRHHVSIFNNNIYIKAFVGGATGSILSQILTVPIDVISQHMMLAGQRVPPNVNQSKSTDNINSKLNLNTNLSSKVKEIERIQVPEKMANKGTFSIAYYISKEIYKNEKLAGFYRGYFLSTFLVSLNSALWWPFYYFYQGKLRSYLPDNYPTIAIQCMCGPLSSFSANFLTNPFDVLRANTQLSKQRISSFVLMRTLWQQDKYRLFYRGLTARLSYSCLYSFLIILGYETVKKNSLKTEYQHLFYTVD